MQTTYGREGSGRVKTREQVTVAGPRETMNIEKSLENASSGKPA